MGLLASLCFFALFLDDASSIRVRSRMRSRSHRTELSTPEGSIAYVVATPGESWKKRNVQKSSWTQNTKWRVCGLKLSFNYGAYFITGFSKAAKIIGKGEHNDGESECSQHSEFSPGFRLGMKLLEYSEPFEAPPTAEVLHFSWIHPVVSIDKRSLEMGVAQVGHIPHSDEDLCCKIHSVIMKCRKGGHCAVWMYTSPSSTSCTCSGKMMADLCNLRVTLDEAMRAEISASQKVRVQDVQVEAELLNKKGRERMPGYRVKLYPQDHEEEGEGEMYSLNASVAPTLAQVRDFVYEYSAARAFQSIIWNNCEHFAAWLLSKVTGRPELNVPHYSILPKAVL